jgi:hypothetical protein
MKDGGASQPELRAGFILITSAPMSASSSVQCGPASARVKSITRIPVSGPAMSLSLSLQVVSHQRDKWVFLCSV